MAMKSYFPLPITGAKNKKKSKVFQFIQQHIFLVNFDSIIPTNKEDPMGTLLSYYRPTKKGKTSHLQIPHVFLPKKNTVNLFQIVEELAKQAPFVWILSVELEKPMTFSNCGSRM